MASRDVVLLQQFEGAAGKPLGRVDRFLFELAEGQIREHIRRRLQAMVDKFSPDLVDVRGRGMMIGVRCADPVRAAAVTKRAYQYGLIIERAGPDDEVIKCMMPLTTTFAELDEGMDILEAAMAQEFTANEFGAGNPASEAVILGILSLIIWSLILVVSVKYIVILLRADNNGEGGTLALMALGHRATASGIMMSILS